MPDRDEDSPFKQLGSNQGLVGPERADERRFWRRSLSLLLIIALMVFVIYVLWKAVHVLLLFFAGALLAVLLRTFADGICWLVPVGAKVSLTIAIFLLVGSMTLAGWLVAPQVAEQVEKLGTSIGESISGVEDKLREWGIGRHVADGLERVQEMAADEAMVGRVAGVFSTTFGALAAALLTVTVAVFLAYQPMLYVNGLMRLIPQARRERTRQVMETIGHTLRWWLVGQLISMAVLFASTWVMLALLGVPLAFILALLTGLLTFIPYLGPILALLPILLIAFVEGPELALWVFILYMVIQNVEANVLMPIVFHKTVHLPPALTLAAQILLGSMLGFLGVVLATPLAAVALVVVQMLYVEDALGDSLEKPLEQQPSL
jgi:predicted PurR-regulated permease PerM